MTESDQRARFRRPVPVLALVFLVLLALFGGTALILNRMAGPDAEHVPGPPGTGPNRAVTSPTLVACVHVGTGTPDARETEDCLRVAEDNARRSPLRREQNAELTTVAHRIRVALAGGARPQRSCMSRTGPCTLVLPSPAVSDTERINSALRAAGYRAAVVREARVTDPAPTGDLIVAVEYPPGCIIAINDPHEIDWQVRPAGLLPDGTCLPA